MPKRIYVTVRNYNARTGEASLVEGNGTVYTVRMSDIQSDGPLQTGMRLSATLDASERSIMRVARE